MRDRTGQVWLRAGNVYVVLGPPKEKESGINRLMHPTVALTEECKRYTLGEWVDEPWEDDVIRGQRLG